MSLCCDASAHSGTGECDIVQQSRTYYADFFVLAMCAVLRCRAAFHNAGVRPELFDIFPRLEYLTLAAHDDKIIQHYLHPWIAAMQGYLEDDPSKQGPKPVWPDLQLLTIRAPFDSHENNNEEDSIDDALEFLGSVRMSMDLPFDVWQECVTNMA